MIVFMIYLLYVFHMFFRQEIIEPEAGVVDGESIRSGKVPVQSIHP